MRLSLRKSVSLFWALEGPSRTRHEGLFRRDRQASGERALRVAFRAIVCAGCHPITQRDLVDSFRLGQEGTSNGQERER
jgi:hypothetical protein